MDPLVIATANGGKLAEFQRLLAPFPCRPLSLVASGFRGSLVEPGVTYAENALAKAAAVSAATGLPALGDDSGIEVIALGGWPGPRSARWLGERARDEDRLRGLLEEVGRCCPHDRRVRYVAALALVRPGADPVLVEGACEGVLVEPRGCNGFGYDPGFLSADLGLTFAQAGREAKDRVSHRGRAVALLAQALGLRPAGPPQWHA